MSLSAPVMMLVLWLMLATGGQARQLRVVIVTPTEPLPPVTDPTAAGTAAVPAVPVVTAGSTPPAATAAVEAVPVVPAVATLPAATTAVDAVPALPTPTLIQPPGLEPTIPAATQEEAPFTLGAGPTTVSIPDVTTAPTADDVAVAVAAGADDVALAVPADAAAAAAVSAVGVAPAALSVTQQAALDTHNTERKKHVAYQLLGWDASLATSATNNANLCDITVRPTYTAPIGVNRWLSKDSYPTDSLTAMNLAVADWIAQGVGYNYSNPNPPSTQRAFTQVVWKKTYALGCSVKSCPSGIKGATDKKTLVVCVYYYAGNVDNQFLAQVTRLSPGPGPGVVATIVNPTDPPISNPGSKSCWNSPNGVYSFCIRSNGKVELVKLSAGVPAALWNSMNTFSTAYQPFRLNLNTTGRLTVTSGSPAYPNILLWRSFMLPAYSTSTGPYKLLIQDDGNVLTQDLNMVTIWQTNTTQRS